MKKMFSAVFTLTLLCAVLQAQNDSSSTPQTGAPQPPQASPNGEPQSRSTTASPSSVGGGQAQPGPMKIAPGSVIPVQLAKTVDAKKAKSGDEVTATVIQDLKTNSGDIIVPKDTKILGHVTEAQARSKEQKESQLGIAFDHAVVKGDQMALPMSIQAIIAPQTNNQAASNGSTPEPAAGGNPSSPMGSGRSASAAGASQPGAQQNAPGPGSSDAQPQTNARRPITANTQGVIGMSDVKLENGAPNATQGSVVTSDKNNVKIEKGTMLLLRVNQ